MQLNPGFQNERLMFQLKETLCCITSPCSAFGLSTLQGSHCLCKVYTLFDGSVLWIHTVTPMLGYLLERFKHVSLGKRGIYQAYTLFPRWGCGGGVCPIAQLLEQGGGQWFCSSATLLTGSRGEQAKLPSHLCAGVNSHME